MNPLQSPSEPFEQGESFFLDEPAYGYYPDQEFNASYELCGETFSVVIQGFVREDAPPFENWRYRVTYPNGEEKILQIIGGHCIEEGGAQTEHAKLLGERILQHFDEEPSLSNHEKIN